VTRALRREVTLRTPAMPAFFFGRALAGVPRYDGRMSVDPELPELNIDIPAQPHALVQLSLLMAEDDVDLKGVSALVESDMALAAAVMKAVNSSLYGLKGRVQSVQQAVTYLGMREIAGITYEMGLRAAFAPAAELEPLWQRAAHRGLLMGRIAQVLGVDAWAGHSAGLFEECGKAVLFRHGPDHYRAMLRAAANDSDLASMERVGFGASHDLLGAALCESWGLGPAVVDSVRWHVRVQAGEAIPPALPRRAVCGLSAVAHALMHDPARLDDVIDRVAPQAALDATLVGRAARKVHEDLGGAPVP
jgi:HD-like signal output (HDOD) protein